MTKTVSTLLRDPANCEADGVGNWLKLFLTCTCVSSLRMKIHSAAFGSYDNEYTTRQLRVSSLAAFRTLLTDVSVACSARIRQIFAKYGGPSVSQPQPLDRLARSKITPGEFCDATKGALRELNHEQASGQRYNDLCRFLSGICSDCKLQLSCTDMYITLNWRVAVNWRREFRRGTRDAPNSSRNVFRV